MLRYPHCDEHDVELAVTLATIEELLTALSRDEHDWAAEWGAYPCPVCETNGWSIYVSAPTMRPASAWAAECCTCHAVVTLWDLRQRVLLDVQAIGRLLDMKGMRR